MSEPPKVERTPERDTEPHLAEWRTFRAHAARPELLLPATALSLGFALILVQRGPLAHPILSYGLMLCITAALYLYGREISRIFDSRESHDASAHVAPGIDPHVQPSAQAVTLEPGQEVEPPELQGSPAIDTGSLAALEQSVGLSTLLEIMCTYLTHAEELIDTLATVADEEQWPDAVRIAQDIAGAASGLGLSAVTLAARSFAQKARDGADSHDLRNTAQMIVGEHLRVRRALAQLYPDLAA
ncbi:MAG TPA: Hpt domain-containing protein [Rhizomicrobium sp.]|jgi:HPt (histidine-containing phosphotransfer) domain-containing protein